MGVNETRNIRISTLITIFISCQLNIQARITEEAIYDNYGIKKYVWTKYKLFWQLYLHYKQQNIAIISKFLSYKLYLILYCLILLECSDFGTGTRYLPLNTGDYFRTFRIDMLKLLSKTAHSVQNPNVSLKLQLNHLYVTV